MVYPERRTTNGITDTNGKGHKVYQITLEGLHNIKYNQVQEDNI
jgi:hypothetical protein